MDSGCTRTHLPSSAESSWVKHWSHSHVSVERPDKVRQSAKDWFTPSASSNPILVSLNVASHFWQVRVPFLRTFARLSSLPTLQVGHHLRGFSFSFLCKIPNLQVGQVLESKCRFSSRPARHTMQVFALAGEGEKTIPRQDGHSSFPILTFLA